MQNKLDRLLELEVKRDEFGLDRDYQIEYDSLKKQIQEAIEFKHRFDENKLHESEKFNLCNPRDNEYCIFEQQNKSLSEENNQLLKYKQFYDDWHKTLNEIQSLKHSIEAKDNTIARHESTIQSLKEEKDNAITTLKQRNEDKRKLESQLEQYKSKYGELKE